MGRSRYKIIDPKLPHFITLTVLHWIPVFTRQETVNILLDSLRLLSKEGLKVYAYVVLENHCHLVVQSEALDRDISRYKSYTAKQMIQYFSNNHVRQDYIHQNPVKRGYVDNAVHWRYSSARNYAGQEGLLDVCQQW